MRNHVTVILGLLAVAFSQSLPYNPTTILYDPNNQGVSYIFLPAADSSTYQLVSLNISSTINPSNISFNAVTPSLPFSSNGTAFTPSISSAGEIYVYTGSCATSTSSALWIFNATEDSVIGNGSWTQESTVTASEVTSASLPGADFLSRGFTFSSFVNANASETDFYVFGGMCPSLSSTTATWQSAANYSNNMLRLTPSSSGTSYTLDVAAGRGPPIAEAGFTITGLTPTYSNGSGVMTQQQNFVLLGGHTETAFINMSQVAVWSLPEETWSFVTVDSPSASSNPNTELTIKSTVTNVDSRSGHTAVLTKDGSKIIVYGGWVGDISQAADPQLAVLELGTGFGGSGDWKWSIPDNQPSGSGLYGHGAALLPGDVMMIYGGYNISSSGNLKRAASQGTQAMFFNTTSMAWATNYTNPSYAGTSGKPGHSSSSTKKIGLGVGLGLGLAIILGALLLYFCYSRHLKRKWRAERDRSIRDLSRNASEFYVTPTQEMSSRGGSFPWSNNGWNRNNDTYDGTNYDRDSALAGYENLHSGVHALGDNSFIPSPPKQIPRKPLHSRARGAYQPASAYDPSQGRANSLGTAGPIHPIYEADENDNDGNDAGPSAAAAGESSSVPGTSDTKRYSDPFKDPPAPTHTTPSRQSTMRSIRTPDSDSTAANREREIQEWVSDWAAADLLMNSQTRSHSGVGRVSPTRRAQIIAASTVSSLSGEEGDSGRTESNLSERTERSVAISALSVSRSGSSSQGRSRANSLRGFITGINPFNSNQHNSTVGGSTAVSTVFDGTMASRALPAPNSSGSGSARSAKSFNTAHTSFQALQKEGEHLLSPPDDYYTYSSPEHSPVRSQTFLEPGSPSKSKPLNRRGWLGSIKKVFTSTADDTPIASTEMSRSRETSPHQLDVGTSSLAPRRAVSAGAMLWRRKQGKSDWDDSSVAAPSPRSNTFTGDGSDLNSGLGTASGTHNGEEEEWDIERAVENRVVQVMFTVPKEKLRVVNHDVSDDVSELGSQIGSLRSKKSAGRKSLRELAMTGEKAEPTVGPVSEDVEVELERELSGGKGKGKEVEKESERVRMRDHSPTPSRSSRRSGKGKVAEIVSRMEERAGSSTEAL